MQRHDGYLSVTLLLERDPEGLSTQAASLVGAFPGDEGGRRLRVDVRNRHWAALVAEIAAAAASTGLTRPATTRQRFTPPSQPRGRGWSL